MVWYISTGDYVGSLMFHNFFPILMFSNFSLVFLFSYIIVSINYPGLTPIERIKFILRSFIKYTLDFFSGFFDVFYELISDVSKFLEEVSIRISGKVPRKKEKIDDKSLSEYLNESFIFEGRPGKTEGKLIANIALFLIPFGKINIGKYFKFLPFIKYFPKISIRIQKTKTVFSFKFIRIIVKNTKPTLNFLRTNLGATYLLIKNLVVFKKIVENFSIFVSNTSNFVYRLKENLNNVSKNFLENDREYKVRKAWEEIKAWNITNTVKTKSNFNLKLKPYSAQVFKKHEINIISKVKNSINKVVNKIKSTYLINKIKNIFQKNSLFSYKNLLLFKNKN